MTTKMIAVIAVLAITTGCMSTHKAMTTPPAGMSVADWEHTKQAVGALDLLSWLGGICILGGVAAMVITRGALGLRALGVGLGLVILNYSIARYADWIFIPVLVASAAISLAYAYRIVRQAILKKKEATS
tara:strand:+ start:5775 stop:6164 length:390 start_codon:yes stop_codon:yes gene_type:complete